jgi:hypothetical protein
MDLITPDGGQVDSGAARRPTISMCALATSLVNSENVGAARNLGISRTDLRRSIRIDVEAMLRAISGRVAAELWKAKWF